MIDYLLMNYIPLLKYLDPIETSRLSLVAKQFDNYIPETYWYDCLMKTLDLDNIMSNANYTTLVYSPTHKTSILNSIHACPLKYICIYSRQLSQVGDLYEPPLCYSISYYVDEEQTNDDGLL